MNLSSILKATNHVKSHPGVRVVFSQDRTGLSCVCFFWPFGCYAFINLWFHASVLDLLLRWHSLSSGQEECSSGPAAVTLTPLIADILEILLLLCCGKAFFLALAGFVLVEPLCLMKHPLQQWPEKSSWEDNFFFSFSAASCVWEFCTHPDTAVWGGEPSMETIIQKLEATEPLSYSSFVPPRNPVTWLTSFGCELSPATVLSCSSGSLFLFLGAAGTFMTVWLAVGHDFQFWGMLLTYLIRDFFSTFFFIFSLGKSLAFGWNR